MDETPVWLDMPGDTTVSRVSEHTVSVRTTGHDKGRFTVVLGAMADGRKLTPFVVFKGVRPIAELNRVQGVQVAMSRNGWMHEELTIEWLDRCWGRLSFQRCLLVWDAYRLIIKCLHNIFTNFTYRCHMTDRVKSHVSSLGSDMVIIPGGLTSQVQRADVSWNKPFKSAYRELYNEWMAYGKKSYTPARNMRQPEKKLCLEWVKQAWAQVRSPASQPFLIKCGGVIWRNDSQ